MIAMKDLALNIIERKWMCKKQLLNLKLNVTMLNALCYLYFLPPNCSFFVIADESLVLLLFGLMLIKGGISSKSKFKYIMRQCQLNRMARSPDSQTALFAIKNTLIGHI